MKKFVVSFLLVISFVLNASPFIPQGNAFSENGKIEGTCGDNIKWSIDVESEVLTISGTGDMVCENNDYGPWAPYRNYFKEVVIEEGIKTIASYAFSGCGIKKLTLPISLEEIHKYAFKNGSITEFVLDKSSKLRVLELDDHLINSTWYKKQYNGVVYLGRLLVSFKGTMSENKVIEVKDGTYAINRNAFCNQTNVTDIIIPDSVERIGRYAFKGTTWYENCAEGAVYAGKVLYDIKGEKNTPEHLYIKDETVSISENIVFLKQYRCKEITVPATIRYIDEAAFYGDHYLRTIHFEENSELQEIGDYAFGYCTHLKIDLPESTQIIGDFAFEMSYSDDENSFYLTENIKEIGLGAFEYIGIEAFDVSDKNDYFCTDEMGVLLNKSKTELISFPSLLKCEEYTLPKTVEKIKERAFLGSKIEKVCLPESTKKIGAYAFYDSEVEEINIPYGVTKIEPYTFASSYLWCEIELPKSVISIGEHAFWDCYGFWKIKIPYQTKYIHDNVFNDFETEVYCYENSTAHLYAIENDMIYILIEDPDTTELEKAIEEAKKINRNNYTNESLEILDEAVESVDLLTIYYTEEQVKEWENGIRNAISNLTPLPADYSKLHLALSNAKMIERSLYTAESLEILDKAVEQANSDYDILAQDKVDEVAFLINEALLNLEYLPADYAKVEAAISESGKYDRRLYSQATLAVLDQSIFAVEYGLNITDQAKVDGFAEQINNAISALEYAAVVLRNEPHGVIVSATAKEIDPNTALTVDLKDSSDLQSGNFAVGGTVKSITLYDINLLLNAQKTQPDGFVTVKIKLPDGVDPKRCKVYHVVDDPVDPLVRYTTALEGNFIVFETDHFSEFAVIEVEIVLNGIEITKLPNKTVYALGETVNTSGLEVTAHYSDGSTKIVSDYDVSSVDTSSIGTKTITVYHTYNGVTKSDSFEITVNGDKIAANITLKGEDINEYNKKVAWYKGYSSESVKFDCNVSGNYKVEWSSDNSNVLVDSNGNVTNKGFFFARKATITVKVTDSAGNILATDSIVVRFYKFSFQLSGIQPTMVQVFKKSGLIY